MHHKTYTQFLAATLLSAGCAMSVTSENSIATAAFITATLPALATPISTATAAAPAALLTTSAPTAGTTTTQINVRSEPSTVGDSLGTIAPFSQVQILGTEENGAWYQIVYVNSTDGKGWVTASYVQVAAAAEIPVIQIDAGAGVTGLVLQPINIRSGPGTGYGSLGNLSANDVVTVTARDASGQWLQIKFKAELGWVASEFLKLNGMDTLPVTADTTEIIPTGESTESGTLLPAQMTYIQDNDSMKAPSASVQLASSGTSAIQFGGTVTSPDGDEEDWLQFTSDGPQLLIGVQCSDIALHVELWNNIEPLEGNVLACEETQIVSIQSAQAYYLRVVAGESTAVQVTPYILKLELVR